MGVAMGKMPDGTSPNYSELQLDASKYLKVAVQGTVSLAATPTIDIGDVQLKNVAGTQVNPATQDTLATIDADTSALAASLGAMTFTHTNVSVGATTTALAAANANRKYLLIVNRSNEMVDVKAGASAVASEGIPLNPTSSGLIAGSYEWSARAGNLTVAAVNGICASGSKTVSVTEGVLA